MTPGGHIDTQIVDGSRPEDLEEAAECLRRGGLVAFPTETVYGLGADALNPDAVRRVFAVKGRPSDNPLIVHISGLSVAPRFTMEIPQHARTLAEHVWPGPLTLVLERNDLVPDEVTAGLDTVALRVPRHPMTEELLRRFDGGIVGPSANLSGKPSPTTAQHVADDLAGLVDVILDGGSTAYGLESTVVDCTIDPPAILRQGALCQEDIERMIGRVQNSTAALRRRSPGTRHRHYAPHAHVRVFAEGDATQMNTLMKEVGSAAPIRVVTHSSHLPDVAQTGVTHRRLASVEALAQQLYGLFREADAEGVTTILFEGTAEHGIGTALMDRLRRASESR